MPSDILADPRMQNPRTGDFFLDSESATIYIYEGSNWTIIQDSSDYQLILDSIPGPSVLENEYFTRQVSPIEEEYFSRT